MMQCSTNEVHKVLHDATSKQEASEKIEREVAETGCLYLEAATKWLEESGFSEAQYQRYLPASIIEAIKLEAIEERLVAPSMVNYHQSATLDFILNA